jgi:hypothetical protein
MGRPVAHFLMGIGNAIRKQKGVGICHFEDDDEDDNEYDSPAPLTP